MFKEALEDIQRFQADREVNKRGVLIYNAHSSAWVRKQWRDIVVSLRLHCCHLHAFIAALAQCRGSHDMLCPKERQSFAQSCMPFCADEN